MRAATGHLLTAVAGTAAVYLLLPARGSADPTEVAGQLVRAAGLTALLWAWLGLVVGLAASTRGGLGVRRSSVLALHRGLNLVALALSVVHLTAFVLAPGGSLLVALVPQTAEVGAAGYTLGVLSLYLAVLLGPSWYLRDRIGRRSWLVLHQFAALSYAAGLWHTLLLGGDVRVAGTLRTVLWVAQLPLLGLFALRLARPRRPADHLEAGVRQPRFGGARHARFRFAVHAGVLLAAFVVLCVAVAAIGPGQGATG